jgi:hypothetical protein
LRLSTRAISSFSAIPPLESQSTQSRLLEDLNLEVTRVADCRFRSRLSPVGSIASFASGRERSKGEGRRRVCAPGTGHQG